MATSRLKAGVAEVEITGEVGLVLASELNPRQSRGIRTPLMAKALVLSDGSETLAIVTLDLFGLPEEAVAKITHLISQQSGLKREAVMLV